MKVNSIALLQTNRQRITYEVDLMTCRGHFPTQFCAHNSTSAVSRIAGNTNLHMVTESMLTNSFNALMLLAWDKFFSMRLPADG